MHRSTAVALGLGLVGLTAAVFAGLSAGSTARSAAPDAILASGFAHELADSDVAWAMPPANVWLSGLGSSAAAFGKLLVVGDRITIDGKDGRPQHVEVTSLEHVDGGRLGLPGLRFQLVTGRLADTTSPGTVRFLFAVNSTFDPAPAAPRPTDRLL
ncbi:MAG: hypothetical protein SFW09_00370 [Hyphomicrobiaceae bacterium]|nr:hypothetical protein [Hyphomicrobiaceae bacterium]